MWGQLTALVLRLPLVCLSKNHPVGWLLCFHHHSTLFLGTFRLALLSVLLCILCDRLLPPRDPWLCCQSLPEPVVRPCLSVDWLHFPQLNCRDSPEAKSLPFRFISGACSCILLSGWRAVSVSLLAFGINLAGSFQSDSVVYSPSTSPERFIIEFLSVFCTYGLFPLALLTLCCIKRY